MQTPFLPDNFEDKYQNMKNKYLIMASPPNPRKQYPSFYHDKYFMDYVDGRCPNLYVLEKNMKYEKNIHEANNDNTISEKHKFNRSFNDRFHFMEKMIYLWKKEIIDICIIITNLWLMPLMIN